jgi:outer membrane protein OmpA-like peptidoglycan-associated protein
MRVSFALNSATLTDEGNREARTFADAVNTPKLSAQHFIVAGHTDARGNPLLNRKLSQRRAQSVVDYLVSQGVDRSRLVAAGFGSDRPLPGTSARDAGNRRVEFARTN